MAGETQRYALRQGHDFLFLFERHCRGRDIDPQAVYAAMGGLPALEPEGETVAQGTREGEGHGSPSGSHQRRKLVRGLTWPHAARLPESTGAVQRCAVHRDEEDAWPQWLCAEAGYPRRCARDAYRGDARPAHPRRRKRWSARRAHPALHGHGRQARAQRR